QRVGRGDGVQLPQAAGRAQGHPRKIGLRRVGHVLATSDSGRIIDLCTTSQFGQISRSVDEVYQGRLCSAFSFGKSACSTGDNCCFETENSGMAYPVTV